MRNKIDFLQDLASKVLYNPKNNCLEWQGCKDKDGYGKTCANYKHVRAHRLMYQEVYNKDITNSFICHRCDNPSCCNVLHLYEGDILTNAKDRRERRDNITDKIRKQAAKFYVESSLSYKDIAEIYNAKPMTIHTWVKKYYA